MDIVNKRNLSTIENIVENHFDLDEDSLSFFKEKIYDPFIPDEIKHLFDENFRFEREIKDNKILEDIDKSWPSFIEYASFLKNSYIKSKYDIEFDYSLYREGFIFISKNKYKIIKGLTTIICDLIDKKSTVINLLPDSIYNYIYNNLSNIDFNRIREMVATDLKNILNDKIPKIGLKVVLSFNFADWFLCSTSESWTSCMSLESEYSDCYWSGLPGLIVDKNRCMIYITDGVKKEYNNIITDRFLFRAWGLLDENNELYIPMVYPNKTKDLFNLYDFFGIKEIGCCCSNFKTKHSIDFLYHKKGDSCFAYSDKSNISNEGDNYYITYSESGGFNYVSKYSEYISSGNIFYYDGGLSNLIDRGINLSEYEEDYCTCDECGERMCNNDSFTGPRDVILCEYCYNNLIVCCENCGATEFSETMDDYNWININDINYCSNCASQVSQICDICGDIELNEYTHSYIDFSNIERICCDKCFIEKIEVCKSCGESYRSNLMKNELCFNCKT
jgi:hypothetical protein